MSGLLPPALVALFAAWCGSFAGGATFSGGAGGVAALLAAVAVVGPPWRDPLRLGRARFLPLGLCAVVAASAWASPVARAGRLGLVLLPGFLWLPGVVERCWGEPRRRRWGLRATSATAAAVALWALLDWAGGFSTGLERAAMPLGHHTLLAAWLVMLLPLAVVTAREAPPWRWLGVAAGILAAAALVAARSTVGLLALAVELLLAWAWRHELPSFLGAAAGSAPADSAPADSAPALGPPLTPAPSPAAPSPAAHTAAAGRRRSHPVVPAWAWLLGCLALAAAAFVLLRRAGQTAAGGDLAWRLRAAYWVAGWRGFLARPLLGWGPGSAPWTVARFLRPVPGANPLGEAVGELHALPVELGYELGLAGLLAAAGLAAEYGRRRLAELPGAVDPLLLAASLLSLAGGAVAGLGTGALRVTALPVAAAFAAGAGLAAAGRRAGGSAAPARIYALLAVTFLAAPEAALWHYDRAVAAAFAGARVAGMPGSGERSRQELARAVDLDPEFPLYRWRLALLASGASPGAELGEPQRAARLALAAARDGDAVAPLWLTAGALGRQAQLPWAVAALEESCRLDPLDPFPAFYLLAAEPASREAPVRGALALLDDPRLLAATFWEGRDELLASCLETVRGWTGLDPGWRESLLAASRVASARQGPRARLALGFDTSPAVSLSLHGFRRRPWPASWPLIVLRQQALALLRLPPASSLPSTFLGAPPRPVCGLGAPGPAAR
jgi:hypothetical protein